MDDMDCGEDDGDLIAAAEFAEAEKKEEDLLPRPQKSESDPSFVDPGFLGFQTGRGRSVSVSEAALSKARQLWKDSEEDEMGVTQEAVDRMSRTKKRVSAYIGVPLKTLHI